MDWRCTGRSDVQSGQAGFPACRVARPFGARARKGAQGPAAGDGGGGGGRCQDGGGGDGSCHRRQTGQAGFREQGGRQHFSCCACAVRAHPGSRDPTSTSHHGGAKDGRLDPQGRRLLRVCTTAAGRGHAFSRRHARWGRTPVALQGDDIAPPVIEDDQGKVRQLPGRCKLFAQDYVQQQCSSAGESFSGHWLAAWVGIFCSSTSVATTIDGSAAGPGMGRYRRRCGQPRASGFQPGAFRVAPQQPNTGGHHGRVRYGP
mmetsp:Transcript_78026/g.252563  ORF Transcript_78026/g.252563 Transcript_78026/m.252563 type:complete len:259 (-) Transcript_78026:417-1193(-)